MDDDLKRLLELTALPTAAGCEQRVIRWIEAWIAERADLELTRDPAGNLVIGATGTLDTVPDGVIYITAHLDHPAFVLEERRPDGRWVASFRGGVKDPYFVDARVRFSDANDTVFGGRVVETVDSKPLRTTVIEFDDAGVSVIPGDIGVWDLPVAHIDGDDLVHTNACDDLAAACAALEALDRLRGTDALPRVRILFTLAEEVGFVGATAACRHETIPASARVIALENSRSFPESPIGGGPIVRIGDRLSTFSPKLTAAITATATALQKDDESFRFQRKLMAGGACEATVFCEYGLDATCVCLPLGNYHNMGDLATVERDAPERATVALETISVQDYRHLVDLLVACGTKLDDAPPVREHVDARYDALAWVIGMGDGAFEAAAPA